MKDINKNFGQAFLDFLEQPTEENLNKINIIAQQYTNEWIKGKASGSNDIQVKLNSMIMEEKERLEGYQNPLKKADTFNKTGLIIEKSDRFLSQKAYKTRGGKEIQKPILNSVQKMNRIINRFSNIENRQASKDGNEIIQIVSKSIALPEDLFKYHEINLAEDIIRSKNIGPESDQGWIKYTTHYFNSLIDLEIETKDKGRFKEGIIKKHQNRRWYFKDKNPWFVKKKLMVKLFKNMLREEGYPSSEKNNFDIYDSSNDDMRIKNIINVIKSDDLSAKDQHQSWKEITHPVEEDYLRNLRKQSNLKFIIIESAYHKTNRQMMGLHSNSVSRWRDVVIYNDGAITFRSLTDDSYHVPAVGNTDEFRDLGITDSTKGMMPSYWVMSNDMPQISNQSLREIIKIFVEEEKKQVIDLFENKQTIIEIATELDIDIIDVDNYLKNDGLISDTESIL